MPAAETLLEDFCKHLNGSISLKRSTSNEFPTGSFDCSANEQQVIRSDISESFMVVFIKIMPD